jgi:hypothetical protein
MSVSTRPSRIIAVSSSRRGWVAAWVSVVIVRLSRK